MQNPEAWSSHGGRRFGPKQLALIREVVGSCGGLSRKELAQTVCELLEWKRASGGLKALECVATRDPDWSARPPAAPPAMGRLVRRCLERDSRARLRDIGEARLALSAPDDALPPGPSKDQAPPSPVWSPRLLVALAAVCLLAGGIGGASRPPGGAPRVRASPVDPSAS